MTMDIVCHTELDPRWAATYGLLIWHKDKPYYFCSERCKERFGKNPERYTEENIPPQQQDFGVPHPHAG